MSLTSNIIKNISKNKDKICGVLLGDIYDEDYKKYSEVYKYELKEFLEYMERNLNTLESNQINITNDILKSYIVTEWFCDLDNYDIKEFNEYVEELLELAKRDLAQQKDFNITDKEKEFIKMLLNEEINEKRNMLAKLSLKDEDSSTKALLLFKKIDIDHYNNLIKDMKEDYIQSINLLYKIFNEQPKDYSTDLSLHNAICKSFNINREEFLF